MGQAKTKTPYELIGGEETLQKLVDAFYPKVYSDPRLAPLFQGDMELIKEKQRLFLARRHGWTACGRRWMRLGSRG